ncbi:hypothetical protein BJ508DRAFT_349950 [Ascobolus immersus RN42]|uniref:Uncharacterized protein n=1 Tax=Ascobolus immersus RN42 TaxID=1160509 RepID=A0A3N4I167_ASCIM|nr:hypothetical protein BJ508DRAFT_349950 [Ascobolus immersus RN42]
MNCAISESVSSDFGLLDTEKPSMSAGNESGCEGWSGSGEECEMRQDQRAIYDKMIQDLEAKHAKEVEILESKCRSYEEEIESLHAKGEAHKKKEEEYKIKVDELSCQKANLEEQVRELLMDNPYLEELQKHKFTIAELRDELAEALKGGNSVSKYDIRIPKTDGMGFKERIRVLEDSLKQALDGYSYYSYYYHQLAELYGQLQVSSDQVTAELASLKAETDATNTKSEYYLQQNDALWLEIKHLYSIVENQQKNNKELERQLQSANSLLDSKAGIIDDLVCGRHETLIALQAASQEVACYAAVNWALNTKAIDVTGQNKDLVTRLEELTTQNGHLLLDYKRLSALEWCQKEALDAASEAHICCAVVNDSLNTKVFELSAQNKNLVTRVEEITTQQGHLIIELERLLTVELCQKELVRTLQGANKALSLENSEILALNGSYVQLINQLVEEGERDVKPQDQEIFEKEALEQ